MKSNKAFTLIELLVVVLIIGILAAIAVPQYQKAVAKSHATEALAVIKSLRPAIEEYVLINNSCPTDFTALSLLPVGTLSKYSIQNDTIIGEYYSYTLIDCRLDSGPKDLNSYAPAFFYQFGKPNWLRNVYAGNIYCYYIDNEDKQSEIQDSICKSLSNSSIINLHEDYNGKAYKM